MSSLRQLGFLCGTGIAGFSFLYFRGHRWSRGAFVLGSLIGLGLLIVSLFPEVMGYLRDFLALGDFECGRLFALLILVNFLTLMLVL